MCDQNADLGYICLAFQLWLKGGIMNSKLEPKHLSLQKAVLQETFSCLVMSDSLRPHGLKHARLPCRLLSPIVCSNSCLLNQ